MGLLPGYLGEATGNFHQPASPFLEVMAPQDSAALPRPSSRVYWKKTPHTVRRGADMCPRAGGAALCHPGGGLGEEGETMPKTLSDQALQHVEETTTCT